MKTKRRIKKIAVIGSGIMGSGIACHFANIGLEVLLLDIVPKSLNEKEEKQKLSLSEPKVRNRIVQESLEKAVKSKPAPLYHPSFKSRISIGNLEDDLSKVADVDWIIEVVVERLDIKLQVFEQIEQHRKPGTLISTNTSGIPIQLMLEGRSDDFKKHFCGTHFFNPARYLKLFEIIPSEHTSDEVISFFTLFADKFLGKTPVVARDTPAFIGNRIGIFSIQSLFHTVKKLDMSVEDVDKLTGPLIGRPKSATFRTVDVVGLDTLVHVANGISEHCQNDERHSVFELPAFIETMMEQKWLGSKTGSGFYKKTKNEAGKTEILSLDLDSLTYTSQKKSKFPILEKTKGIDNVIDRFPILISGDDKASLFYRKSLGELFAYVSHRVGEITDALYKIDDAMKAGFGWQHGPFQIWDAIGFQKGIELIAEAEQQAADWITSKSKDDTSFTFYQVKEGLTYYFDQQSDAFVKKPGADAFIILDNIREKKTIFTNSECAIQDLGDGVLNMEFQSKMNTIGGDVLAGLNKAVDIAEKEYEGLIIGNQGENFSVGANIGMIFMMAVEQEYEELNMAIKYFQDTVMRMRYSSIPTVVAPHGLTLGGGCELSMHADSVVAAAETYIGLVEFGVGVIPGGAGSKEMTLRAASHFRKNDVELNVLQEYFMNIGMAKVATSAYEAFDIGVLQQHKDLVIVNKDRQIAEAKKRVLSFAEKGYTQPIQRKDVKVLGKQALGMFLVGIDGMQAGGYISEHDKKIASKLAYVMSGGDLSSSQTVSEQYLLDIEREAFLSLCGERKTIERIQHMLKTGKPLRN